MRRRIAAGQTWWLRLFVLGVLAAALLPVPVLPALAGSAVLLGLSGVRPPRSTRTAVDVRPPVRGRWVPVNSPGSAVPSHGTRAYGQTYAVDLLQPSPDAPASIGWSPSTRSPGAYACFGEPVLAMASGRVVAATDRRRDHRSRDSWPALVVMLAVEALVRELGGARWILGNSVVVDHGDGTYAAYAHLRRGSLEVRPGDRVQAGQRVGAVGNTGNTSEPHLHVQLMDRPTPTAAAGVPMRWSDLSTEADLDPRWSTGEPKPTAVDGVPRNGQVFEVPLTAGQLP